MVVEDDATDRLLIREMLDDGPGLGLTMAECDSLESARTAIGAGTICVLIDNLLRDGLGMSALPELRRRWPGLSIVMLTGSGDELTSAEALKRGANDYLPKHLLSGSLLRRTIIGAIDRMRLAEAIRLRAERLALLEELTDSAEDLLFVVDCQGESIVTANAATRRALSESGQDEHGLPAPVADLFRARDAGWSALRELLSGTSPVRLETAVCAGDYFGRPVEISARAVVHGKRRYVIGIGRDIVEQRRLQADLLRFSALDPQTGLPTQAAFAHQLERWVAEHPSAAESWTLCAAHIPSVSLSTLGTSRGALVHARVRVARLIAEFAIQHGGFAGLSADSEFLAAVPVEGGDSADAVDTLASALVAEMVTVSMGERTGGPNKSLAQVGVGALRGSPRELSMPAAFRQVAALAYQSLISRGRIQWEILDLRDA